MRMIFSKLFLICMFKDKNLAENWNKFGGKSEKNGSHRFGGVCFFQLWKWLTFLLYFHGLNLDPFPLPGLDVSYPDHLRFDQTHSKNLDWRTRMKEKTKLALQSWKQLFSSWISILGIFLKLGLSIRYYLVKNVHTFRCQSLCSWDFCLRKPEMLESWNFERRFIQHYVSRVMCHVSPVTCHLSCVTCHVSPVTCHVSPVTCHM